MDDLKLQATNNKQLETLRQTVRGFTKEVNKKFRPKPNKRILGNQ